MKERSNNWINKLNLSKHPEGGYFSEIYRSGELIDSNALPERYSGDRCFSTSIYFMITDSSPSKFHKILSDEIWHFHDGAGLIIHLIDKEGNYSTVNLGRDICKEKPQAVIPHGTWMAAEVNGKENFSLIGCTSAPGFEFDDFQMADRKDLIDISPDNEELINKLT